MLKYLISLLITLVIEGCVTAVISRKPEWVLYVCIVNIMTNPMANVLYNGLKPLLSDSGRYGVIVVIEVLVVLSEGALFHLYRKNKRRGLRSLGLGKCMLYSLGLNALSFGLGIIIGRI